MSSLAGHTTSRLGAVARGLLQRARRERRVAAARRAAADRSDGVRRLALARAWRASADFDAAPRPSRRKALLTARERRREAGRPRRRPEAASCTAFRRVCLEAFPAAGARSLTPARRAFDSPIAMACFVERAPCFPSLI